ncbi:MAG: histone deacetylase family protein [Hydrogenophilales bacterium]|nr:histone deacetylase family protein [Hydrogenophilales bacterium]
MATAYLTHPDCLRHDMGGYHPEQPARLTAIEDALHAAGLFEKLHHFEALPATREQLLRAHGAAYLDEIERTAPQSGLAYLDPDTAMNPYSLSASLHAAGALTQAVDSVMRGEVANAFCAVRPPGHHALRNRAMGFCIFNNVAIGALHALDAHGLQRVAIVDFDVHHGNGTEDIFHDDSRVILCSSFQHPYYPFSGADSGNAHIIPMPLAAGSGGKEFRDAWLAQGLPALERFQPQMIFFSAGFDAHRDDPLAGLMLVEEDFAWITGQVLRIADHFAQGRVVSTLEGGYELEALGLSVAAHIQALNKVN